MPVFVDTNVFVYRFDESDLAKSARSEAWLRELWESGEGRLSVQVVQELYVTLTRKVSQPMPQADARLVVGALFSWDPVVPDRAVLEAAWALEERYSLSWWDSLIVAAAQISGCTALLTEDLSRDGEIDGVRIVDPFRVEPDSLRAE